jgi:uracil-DNA glycosylase
MGLCYPGKNKNGDLPPRRECAELYFEQLFKLLPDIQLSLLIGNYAQNYHLSQNAGKNLTETVKNWRDYLPGKIVLPHPSPRNVAWFKNNPWFEEELLPYLKERIKKIIC